MTTVKEKKGVDATLAAVVAHPVRARAFMLLAERTVSPVEIAKRLGEDVNDVAYHVRKLRELNLIELVDERPVRGAVEHFYRAIMRPIVSAAEQATQTPSERNVYAREVCQLIFAGAAAAIHSEIFSSRPDNQYVRIPMLVDSEGYEEASKIYEEALPKLLEVQARSAGRMAESGEAGLHVEADHLLYERQMDLDL